MAIRNNKLGGTDFADGEILYDYDLDDTNNAILDEIPFQSSGIQESEYAGTLTHASSSYIDLPNTSITVNESGRYFILATVSATIDHTIISTNPATFYFKIVKNGNQLGKISGLLSRGYHGAVVYIQDIQELDSGDVLKIQIATGGTANQCDINANFNNTSLKLMKLGNL